MRLGIVGVGTMGGAMAGRAIEDGLQVVVCDANPDATRAFADRGAEVANSPRELADLCDIAAVVVLDDAQVRDVVTGVAPHCRPGTLVVVTSTVHPATMRDLAGPSAAAGGRYRRTARHGRR